MRKARIFSLHIPHSLFPLHLQKMGQTDNKLPHFLIIQRLGPVRVTVVMGIPEERGVGEHYRGDSKIPEGGIVRKPDLREEAA